MKLKRSMRALSLVLTVLLLLTGCSRQTASQGIVLITPEPTTAPAQSTQTESIDMQETKTLNVGYVAAQGSDLHPLRGNARDLNSLNSLVFESLVELDENRQPTALLCDRWESSAEEGVWYFYLRSGIVFHDGSPLTAYDVVASYEDIIANSDISPYYNRVKTLSEVSAVDELTVRVVSDTYGYMTLYAMTFPIVQQYSLDAQYPKGTGPYWYVSYNSWGLLRLEANPLWWKQQGDIQAINVKRYDEVGEAMEALTTGQIDIFPTSSSSASLSRQLSDRTTMDYTTLTWECLVPDLRNSILSDTAVREALMYGIDRTSLASTVYLGMVQESEVPVIPGSWLYETQSARYNYNPERALQLLYDAGWSDSNGDGILDRVKDGLWEDLQIDLITYNEPTISSREKAAELIASHLAIIGIRVNVTVTTRSKVLKAINSDTGFSMALVGFNLSYLPDLSYLFKSSASGNCSFYSSEKMDTLLAEAKKAPSADELKSIMADIQQLIVDDLPLLGLFFRSGTLVSRISLGGLSGIREDNYLRGIDSMILD